MTWASIPIQHDQQALCQNHGSYIAKELWRNNETGRLLLLSQNSPNREKGSSSSKESDLLEDAGDGHKHATGRVL